MTITAVFENLDEAREFAAVFGGLDAGQEVPGRAGGNIAATVPPAQNVQPQAFNQSPVQNTQLPAQNAQAPVQPPVQDTQAASVPVAAAQQYTLDDLARAGMTLMDAGRQADLQGLLSRFGVEALPMLAPGQYGAFATALREMGAQI